MYKQAIVYKTFIQTVFGSLVYGSPHTMTNQDNKQCDSLCLDSHQQLCIGDRVTFQVYGNLCNSIVIVEPESNLPDTSLVNAFKENPYTQFTK